MERFGDFQIADVPTRTVDRVVLVLGLRLGGRNRIAAITPDGDLVWPVGNSEQNDWQPLAVARDGRRIIYSTPYINGEPPQLCSYHLSSDERVWLERSRGETIESACFSPDSADLGILSTRMRNDEYVVAISRTDSSGLAPARVVWEDVGGTDAESTISWSPGGDLIAATYQLPDEDRATVVVSPAGDLVSRQPGVFISQSPNGAWTTDGRLVCCHETSDSDALLTTYNVREDRHWNSPNPHIPFTVADDKIIDIRKTSDRTEIIAAKLDSSDEECILRLHPRCGISFLDAADRI